MVLRIGDNKLNGVILLGVLGVDNTVIRAIK